MRCVLAGLGALTLALCAASAGANPLALARVTGADRPEMWIAQRSLEREWGEEDSVAVRQECSEGLAMALSAVVPGAGQAYVGHRDALVFALAEAIGWTARIVSQHRADEFDDQAVHFVGSPLDSTGTWSFERWAGSNEGDVSGLEALYAADRDAFFDLIASDPRYLAGWAGNSTETRAQFGHLLDLREDRLQKARYASLGLWLNHLAAAFDALRVARLANVRLRDGVELKVKSGWGAGGPAVFAALERSF